MKQKIIEYEVGIESLENEERNLIETSSHSQEHVLIFLKMDDLTQSCINRVNKWKNPISKPAPDIRQKVHVDPDVDTKLIFQRFAPSNKIPIGKRYKIQSVFQKHLTSISNTDSNFIKAEANEKELEIFNQSKDESEYQQHCIETVTHYNAQEKLLKGLTLVE